MIKMRRENSPLRGCQWGQPLTDIWPKKQQLTDNWAKNQKLTEK